MAAMARPTLKLSGGFEFCLTSGESQGIPTRKAECLLAYLALQSGEPQSREKLIGLFWSDSDEKRAQGSLRQTLTYLRQSLAGIEPPPLITERGRVSLDANAIEVDVLRFRELTNGGSTEDLEAAANLYKGEILEGYGIREPAFEDWLESERRDFREHLGRVLLTLAGAKTERGHYEDAIRVTQRLLSLDPLLERAHRLLMETYGASGQREAAIQQYHRCRLLLAKELGVEPEEETQALHDAIRGNGFRHNAVTEPVVPASPYFAFKEAPNAGSIAPEAGQDTRYAILIPILVLLFIFAGGVVWFQTRPRPNEISLAERLAHDLPAEPSIAVLPFVNLNGDPRQDYFADGITDDLITDLSKVPGLFVISRNSTFAYKGKSVPIKQIAEELRVAYLLEGNVRREGERVRINVQLTNAVSGGHLWAERYDAPLGDVLDLQDQVTAKVVQGIKVRFAESESAKGARKETNSAEAYDAVLHAMEHIRRSTKDDLAIAIIYLEKAISLDPDYARAHTILGGILWDVVNEDWERSFDLSKDEALSRSRHHMQLGAAVPSPVWHFFRSKVHSNEGRYEEAIAEAEKMIAMDPNNVHGYRVLARAFNKAGLPSKGLAAMQAAKRRDPWGDNKGWMSYRLGESLYLLGRYEEAIEQFMASVLKNGSEWCHLFLAAAYGQLGQAESAGKALSEFNRIREEAGQDPYSVAHLEGWAFKRPEDRQRVQEGLLKAGMPPGASASSEPNLAQDTSPAEVPGATTIDGLRAKELMEQGAVVVDVRGSLDWAAGHIPGAVHLYLFNDFTEKALASFAAKSQPLVLYGQGANASPIAARAVARAVSWGYTKIYYFRDGLPGWKEAGHPFKVVLD